MLDPRHHLWLVLIESDWNLKFNVTVSNLPADDGINRIRLEFKGNQHLHHIRPVRVLIESDWNLKPVDLIRSTSC